MKNLRLDVAFNSNEFARFFVSQSSSLYELASRLTSTSFLDGLRSLFITKSDYVYSIRKYPFDVRQLYRCSPWTSDQPLQNLKLGGYYTGIMGIVLGGVGAYHNEKGIALIGDISINRIHNNFMDYEPYTQIKIYVPYFGFYDLPTNEVMGRKIQVYWGCDLFTGIATFWVVRGDNEVILLTESKPVGIDIPMGKTNNEEIARNNISNGLKATTGAVALVAGVATKGASLLATTGGALIASSGISAINGNVQHFQKGQVGGNYMSLSSPNSVFVIIEHPKVPTGFDASRYGHTRGYPLGEFRTLSTLTGFTKVGEVHLTDIKTATSEELDMIESELKSGVLL